MFLYYWQFLCNTQLFLFLLWIFTTFLRNRFKNYKFNKQILLTVLIIAITISLSFTFNEMLRHLHDMQAGYFLNNCLKILIPDRTYWGLSIGWFVILTSNPYNIFGFVIFFLTKKVLNYLILTLNNQPIISNIDTFREFFRNTFVHTH